MAECVRFTYGGDPSASPRDAVRFLVGDTIRSRPLLDDREVDYALSEDPNKYIAASNLAAHLSARFSRESDVTVGSVSKSLSKIAEAFDKLAGKLKARACKGVKPSFPATTRSGKEALQQNDSLPNPNFSIGLTDNPWAVQLNDELDGVDWRGW